jgi:hypothetical protein
MNPREGEARMRAKIIGVTVMVMVAASVLAGSSPARESSGASILKGISFNVVSGPSGITHRGARYAYVLNVINGRAAGIKQFQVDVFLPKQNITATSVKLMQVPGTKTVSRMLVGHHLRWVVDRLPGTWGDEIHLNAQVQKTASGTLCNKLTLTYLGKVYNYSPACVSILSGV